MSHLIEVDRLVKTYDIGEIGFTALQGISLLIERGDFVAIMGPSGSGKSTLMNLLGCLDQPTSGTYRLDGVVIGGLDRDQLAEIRNRKIGFVFQNYQLLPRATAVENVELPLLYSNIQRAEHRKRALAALAALGMSGREYHFPNQLSGGQQQRVAIARAIVNNPQLILADEPTGALDSRTSVEIMSIFQQLNSASGISIVLVTHEVDIAQFAKRIIQFRDGRIVHDEPVHNWRSAEVAS
ncbi:MAG: macrolide ABC transporter ATP-binding protein [Acidobacteria bacterium]|nr:MAG: macrolide ABC transporter ATP-binding protein [Acidobacteriota bacterium]